MRCGARYSSPFVRLSRVDGILLARRSSQFATACQEFSDSEDVAFGVCHKLGDCFPFFHIWSKIDIISSAKRSRKHRDANGVANSRTAKHHALAGLAGCKHNLPSRTRPFPECIFNDVPNGHHTPSASSRLLAASSAGRKPRTSEAIPFQRSLCVPEWRQFRD